MINTPRVLAWPAFKSKLCPYTPLLYGEMQRLGATVEEFSAWRVFSGRYDILHLHFPEYCVNERGPLAALFWSSALFVAMCWVRVRGGKVIWTVHNLESHLQQRPAAERHFFRVFTALLNGYTCLTAGGAEKALERFPNLRRLPGFVIPLGNLRDGYPHVDMSQAQARSQLGIPLSAKVLGFFGSVQRYKGITELVRTFSALPDANLILYVAGRSSLSAKEQKEIEHLAAVDGRVHLHLEYIPPQQVAAYIRAVDLMVLPFRNILNSGTAVLSIAMDRPILVPAKGSMLELREFAGHRWVRVYSGDLTPELLRKELDYVLRESSVRDRCFALERGWNGLTWRDLAQLTLRAYDSVLQPHANRQVFTGRTYSAD